MLEIGLYKQNIFIFTPESWGHKEKAGDWESAVVRSREYPCHLWRHYLQRVILYCGKSSISVHSHGKAGVKWAETGVPYCRESQRGMGTGVLWTFFLSVPVHSNQLRLKCKKRASRTVKTERSWGNRLWDALSQQEAPRLKRKRSCAGVHCVGLLCPDTAYSVDRAHKVIFIQGFF